MKPRHAAALALGFWLLATPPIHETEVDLTAPLKHWRASGHFFDSLDDCQAYKVKVIAGSSVLGAEIFDQVKAAQREKIKTAVKQAISDSTCVSSDDPRLKGS
jgi:uncharacterized protein YfaP (DUF2135 family)